MFINLLVATVPASFLGYALFWGNYSSNFLYFIIFFCIGYIVIFSIILKPDKAIYAYLILWVTFPKFIRFFPVLGTFDLPGGSYFDIFHALAALTIAITLFLKKEELRKINVSPSLKRFYLLFLVTAIVTLVSSFMLLDSGEISFASEIKAQFFSRDVALLFYGLIFFLGLMAFIKEMRQVEIILGILVLAGALLVGESILVFHLGIVPGLNSWALNVGGAFQSLIFLNTNWVGLFCILSLCSGFYFVWKYRKFQLLPLVLLIFIPALAIYQKAALGGMIVALGTFCYLSMRRQVKIFVLLGLVFLASAMLFSEDNPDLFSRPFERAVTLLGGEVRPTNYWTEGSGTSRFGSYLRTLDVIVFFFPLGVGEGLGAYYLSSSVPTYFSDYTPDRYSSKFYETLTTGKHQTSTHNLYLQYVMENGLLGILVLVSFLYLTLKNAAFFKRYSLAAGFHDKTVVAQASVYAALAGVGFSYLFDSSSKLYFIFFLLLFLTFLLRQVFSITKVQKGGIFEV